MHVPPYASLVAAYERRENGPGEAIDMSADAGNFAVSSTRSALPDDVVIDESFVLPDPEMLMDDDGMLANTQ